MTITVNEPGAHTIREARPMLIEGREVTVTTEGRFLYLNVGGRSVDSRPEYDITAYDAQRWAVSYRDGTDKAPVAAKTPVAGYAAAVAAVRAKGAEMAIEADRLLAAGEGTWTGKDSRGRTRTYEYSSCDHPARRGATYRRWADTLLAWTEADERGYLAYVSAMAGDTDGWFAPHDRLMWSATCA